jgi:hypothetical protein
VTFIDRPFEEFFDALTALRTDGGTGRLAVTDPEPVPACLRTLDPMQAPWTVDVAIECGYGTGYLDNGLSSGDPTAVAPAVARRLGARADAVGRRRRRTVDVG